MLVRERPSITYGTSKEVEEILQLHPSLEDAFGETTNLIVSHLLGGLGSTAGWVVLYTHGWL